MAGVAEWRDAGVQTLSDVSGGSFSGGGESSAAFQSMPYSAFGLPFAGWLTLSDMIADSVPELGDAMRALAEVLQAAFEQSVAARFPEIRALLTEAGIPRWSVEDTERAFLSGMLPLSVRDLADEAGQAYAELAETGTVEITQPASAGFMASVMHYGGHAVLGAETDEDARPPRLPVRREDLPDAFLDYFLPATPLRVAASLELPVLASGREFSIWCRRPLRPRRGDNLVATEYTYVNRQVDGLTNPRFQGSGAAVTSQYRGDIAEWRPTDFTESIDLGRPLDNFYYVYKLTEPKRSRAIRRLRKVLDYGKVRDVLGQAVAAGANVGMAAAGPVGPLVAPLAGLAGPTARILADGLVSRLETALADTNMTPWSITHTTLYIPEYPVGPLSMFILVSPAAPGAKLYRIRRDDYDPDRSVMDLGYQEKVRAYQQGRGMMGVTVPPARPCPSDLWGQVAAKNQPAAWTEPGEDGGGFRVLVPHAEAGKDVNYVSALRADVIEGPRPAQAAATVISATEFSGAI
jgi:hypothetical protein